MEFLVDKSFEILGIWALVILVLVVFVWYVIDDKKEDKKEMKERYAEIVAEREQIRLERAKMVEVLAEMSTGIGALKMTIEMFMHTMRGGQNG